MVRLRVWGLILVAAIASCTSAPTGDADAHAAARYARYYFVAPTDTGVLEVWTRPATICYSTQSHPARPIDLVATVNGQNLASYHPPTIEHCDRRVNQDVATALAADPSSFAIRWSPRPGQPLIETPLTITDSRTAATGAASASVPT